MLIAQTQNEMYRGCNKKVGSCMSLAGQAVEFFPTDNRPFVDP